MIWQIDIPKTFGSTLPRWAFSSSPVLLDEVLILEVGGKNGSAFVGFNQLTGDIMWKKGDGEASYCSPAIGKINGATNIIFANQTNLLSFNSKGDTLWSHAMSVNGPMAMPVFFDGNKIFISTIRSKGFCIVEIKDNNATELLTAQSMKNDFSSSVYYDGHFYGFNVAALQCISATTGEKKWTKRGFGKGSLILVDDSLLILSDKGKLIQVKASAENYMEQGEFQALEGKSWTAPSFANGKLFLRNLTEMACYKLK